MSSLQWEANVPRPRRHGWERIRGHQIYWEIHGPEDGEVVVLLHHGLGSIRSWKRQIPALAEAGFRVLAYDRWGYGRADPRPEFTSDFLERDAEEALTLLDVLGVDQVSLVGHSDGGAVALVAAASAPGRIYRLILVCAHIYREKAMMSPVAEAREESRKNPLRKVLAREHGGKRDALVAAWADCWLGPCMEGFDLRSRLAMVRCPTLVMHGVKDKSRTTGHARAITDGISQAELWLIPDAGHMPPHEVPEEFNKRVLEFLRRT